MQNDFNDFMGFNFVFGKPKEKRKSTELRHETNPGAETIANRAGDSAIRLSQKLLRSISSKTGDKSNLLFSPLSMLRVFDTEIPFSVRAAESSIEGKSIFSHGYLANACLTHTPKWGLSNNAKYDSIIVGRLYQLCGGKRWKILENIKHN